MENIIASRYKVLKKLGEGGMGQVLKAHDKVLDRLVAIKILSPSLTKKQEFLQRFLREARITASLNHINIVKIYDLIFYQNQYYLIMEYIDGTTVRTYLDKRQSIDESYCLDLFLQILEGIEYAHSKNIVHRDLKPENIMLDKEGIIKITDFGLAFAIGNHSLTNPGILMGTLAYLSPEQAKGIDIDHLTDIYSLGVILYELLTSNLPIVDLNPATMIYKILNDPPTKPSVYNPNIDKRLENIILKCLNKDKKQRYSSVSQFKKDIIDFLYSDVKESTQTDRLSEDNLNVDNSFNLSNENLIQQEELDEAHKTDNVDNVKIDNIKIDKIVSKTLSDVLADISSYKKNIPDIVYNVDNVKIEQDYTLSPRDIELLLERAQKEYENKNYYETINILENILPYYKSKTVLYVLAKSYYKIGDFEKALHYVKLHKSEYGESQKILLIEADALFAKKDYPGSFSVYYRIYEITGDRYYLLLACRAAINYDPRLVIDTLSTVVAFEKDPHVLAKSYKYLGLAYYKVSVYDLAITNFEEYLKIYHSDNTILPQLINSYKMVGKNLELAKIYSSILEITDDVEMMKDALYFYITTNNYKEVIEIAYKLVAKNPDDLSVYQDLYLASKAINNSVSLIMAIENILRLHKDLDLESKIELMDELLNLYEEEQQYNDAINLTIQLLSLSNFNVKYKYKLADLYYNFGNYEEALNVLYELLSVNSSDPLIYEKIGIIYHKQGNIEQAIQSLKSAIELEPSNYKYYKTLSILYLESNQIDQLIDILKNLIDYNPNDLEAYILLSQVFLNMKNYYEAYENILIAYLRSESQKLKLPLKAFDILVYIFFQLFKGDELLNKLRDISLEFKNPSYLPYIYYCIAFLLWVNGYSNYLEYLNNSLMLSRSTNNYIFVLSNALLNFSGEKYFHAIKYLEDNQNIFKEIEQVEIKKRYYELLLTFYLLTNSWPQNITTYFNILGDLSESYEYYGLFLKGMFIEKFSLANLPISKANISNVIFLYEKVIENGWENEKLLFKIFFLNYIISDYKKAENYIQKLITKNPQDQIYLYYFKKIKENKY